jgi:hypothetical protein
MGALFGLGSLQFPTPSVEGDVGSAFFPKILSLLLMLLGSVQFAYSLRHNRSSQCISVKNLWRVIGGILLCTLYVTLFPIVGYFYATAAFCPLFLLYQGYKKLSWTAVITLGFLVMAYWVFFRFLAVALPV